VTRATVSADGETIIVHIPMTFRKRGVRKLVVTPDGVEWAPRPRVDNAMVKALARAFRWRKILDEGVHGTLEDLARAKGVHATYVSRVLRLTLLVPEIVEAILDGRQPAELQLDEFFGRVSVGVGVAACIHAMQRRITSNAMTGRLWPVAVADLACRVSGHNLAASDGSADLSPRRPSERQWRRGTRSSCGGRPASSGFPA
jgi:hypothetical protein